MIIFYVDGDAEEVNDVTNAVISASRSYQSSTQKNNVKLAESAKNMLNKTLQLGQR